MEDLKQLQENLCDIGVDKTFYYYIDITKVDVQMTIHHHTIFVGGTWDYIISMFVEELGWVESFADVPIGNINRLLTSLLNLYIKKGIYSSVVVTYYVLAADNNKNYYTHTRRAQGVVKLHDAMENAGTDFREVLRDPAVVNANTIMRKRDG